MLHRSVESVKMLYKRFIAYFHVILAICRFNFQNGIEGLSIEAPNYECGNDTQNENQIKDKGWIIESVRSSMKILCPNADVCSENQGDLVSPPDLCCADCSCAEDCGMSENKTCCFQPVIVEESTSTLQRECIRVNHVGVGPSPSYYMVVACPNDFPYTSKEMESIAHSCENIIMPVFSNTTKLVYKNRYCAQCHMVTQFTNWTSSLVCNRKGYVVYIPNTSLFPNCYIHFEYPGSLLDIQNSRCCSNIGTSEFVFPDNVPVKNLSRSDIISLCESDFYSPYLYKIHTIVRELYANIYCAMCSSFVPMYTLKPGCKSTSIVSKDSKPFVSIIDTRVVEDVTMKNRLPEVACRTMNSSSQECRQTRCPFGRMYNKAGKCEYITMRGDVKQFAVPLKLSPSPPFQDCSLEDIIDVNNIMSHLKSPWPKPWKIYKSFRQTSLCNCSDRMECLTYFGVVFEGPKTHAYFGEVMLFIESMISEDWYLATNGKAVRLMSAFLDLDAFNDRALWYLSNTTDDFDKHFVAPKFFPISKFDYCEQVPLEEDEYILKEPLEDKEIILYIKEFHRILLPSEYMLHTRADGTVFPTVCLSDTSFRKVSKSTGDRLDYMEYIHAIALIVIVVVIDDTFCIYNFIGCAYMLSSF